jgi:serine protease AprX
MLRMVRVFAAKQQQAELAQQFDVVERYDGFILLEVSVKQRDQLAKSYPLEDLTRQFEVRIGDRKIRTDLPRIDSRGRTLAHPAYKGVKKLAPGKHHYLVQFIGPIKKAWLSNLKRLGAEPRAPYGDYAYVTRCSAAVVKRVAGQRVVRWVGHLSHRDRIEVQSTAKALPRTRGIAGAYRLEFFDGRDLVSARSAIRRTGAKIISHDEAAGMATVEIDATPAKTRAILARLSAVHGVRAIRRHAFKRASNDVATRLMTTRRASAAPLALSGKGETVAVCDTGIDVGSAASIHPDFAGRVAAIKSYPIGPDFAPHIKNPGGDDGPADYDSGHGTHVAGSALGSGANSQDLPGQRRPIRGLAHRAKLVFQAVEQQLDWKDPADVTRYGRYLLAGIPADLTGLFHYAYQQGARIHSNSWGGGEPGEYDAQCEQLDRFVWTHQDFCVLVAAGNDGTDKDGDGVINPMSVTSPATAKNCITVGASENRRPQFNGERYGDWWPRDYPVPPFRRAPMANGPAQVVAFSSRGPTQDGRVKPDVIAPGTFILSARSRAISPSNHAWASFPASSDYFYMGGTSMATPLASGAAACLREFLRVWVGCKSPSAALIKASLIGGASKLRGTSPASQPHDNDQGYGLVNLDAVVAPPAKIRVYFHDDAAGLETGQVDDFEIEVRSSGAPLRAALAYSDYPGPRLVNNLNLILVSPGGRNYVGNATRGATLALDNVNNSELVHIQKPRPGQWTMRVVASNVPNGPQRYAYMLSGDVRI